MPAEDLEDGAFFRERVTAAKMALATESPIEIMFGMAMLKLMEDDWFLTPQFNWRSYRIDWALERPDQKPIFIECDGNEFHTRPEHVARDRRRDQDIRRARIKLFRFTGSEIYRNAAGCALRVYLEARK